MLFFREETGLSIEAIQLHRRSAVCPMFLTTTKSGPEKDEGVRGIEELGSCRIDDIIVRQARFVLD